MGNVHTVPTARRASPVSTVSIDVKDGKLNGLAVHALTPEDPQALHSGISMALVQVVRATEGA